MLVITLKCCVTELNFLINCIVMNSHQIFNHDHFVFCDLQLLLYFDSSLKAFAISYSPKVFVFKEGDEKNSDKYSGIQISDNFYDYATGLRISRTVVEELMES